MTREYHTSQILTTCSEFDLEDEDIKQYIEVIAQQSIDDLDTEKIESAVALKFFRFERTVSQVNEGCSRVPMIF